MMKWFNKKQKEPRELAKAYIEALRENPERTRLSKWEQLKYDIVPELDEFSKSWLVTEYNAVRHELYMTKIAQYRLTGEADKEPPKHVSAKMLNTATHPNQYISTHQAHVNAHIEAVRAQARQFSLEQQKMYRGLI